MGGYLYLAILQKKSYSWPISNHANFQGSSFKMGGFEKLTLFATLTPRNTKGDGYLFSFFWQKVL